VIDSFNYLNGYSEVEKMVKDKYRHVCIMCVVIIFFNLMHYKYNNTF
jgi:hypothetical protein